LIGNQMPEVIINTGSGAGKGSTEYGYQLVQDGNIYESGANQTNDNVTNSFYKNIYLPNYPETTPSTYLDALIFGQGATGFFQFRILSRNPDLFSNLTQWTTPSEHTTDSKPFVHSIRLENNIFKIADATQRSSYSGQNLQPNGSSAAGNADATTGWYVYWARWDNVSNPLRGDTSTGVKQEIQLRY